MGSRRRGRSYKPRGRTGGHSSSSRRYRSRGTQSNNRAYRPRNPVSAFNRFRQPRHHQNHRQSNDNRPIAQGDGTWYDPNTGEYFRKETLMDMLKRWGSFFTGGKR